MKAVLYGLGAIAVIVVVVVVGVFFFSGNIVKTAVEELGPKLTQTEVKLDKVDLSLAAGAASLSGLLIGNPEGFNTPHAFKLNNIRVRIDTGTLGSDTIVIKEIIIDQPDAIAEFKTFAFNPVRASASVQEAMQNSNFMTIQRNVNAFVGKSGGSSKASGDSGEGPNLIIEKFRMNDLRVRAVSQSGLPLDQTLPPFSISLNDIGKKENGLKPEAIAAILIPRVQQAVMNGMAGDLQKAAFDVAKTVGGIATEGAKAATEGAKKAVEGAGGMMEKTLEEGAKGASDALKGIFGGNK